MAVLAVRSIVKAGLDDAALGAAAAGGDAFALDGTKKTFLRVKNANAASRTVTIASQLPAGAVPEGAAAANLAVVVTGLKDFFIGPIDPVAYRDANGRAVVTYSTEADLTVGAYAL